jgi:hypothetical protein
VASKPQTAALYTPKDLELVRSACRWKHRRDEVTVDFLIAPTEPAHAGAKVRVIEADLSAVLAKGLPLAFLDRRKLKLSGKTLRGEDAARDVWVCGARGAATFLELRAREGVHED